MPRGYSGNRSTSSRPTLKAKRKRSVSMQKLRDSISRSQSSASTATAKDESQATRKPVRRVIRAGLKIENLGFEDRKVSQSKDNEESADVAKAKQPQDPKNVFVAQKLAKEHMEDLEASEDEEETTRRQDVMTKYKAAGKLVDEVLNVVASKAVTGANTYDLCTLGDKEMRTRVKGVFGKAKNAAGEKLPRGIAYPCNVSVNNMLCNHSPSTAADAITLSKGDIVKIHLAVHIDGYPVTAVRTVVVDAADGTESFGIEASAARAVEAARVALNAVVHLLRPGAENADITDYIHRVGAFFDVEAVEGVLSTRTKRWITDSMEAIITRRVTREDPQQDVAPVTIKPFQVWTLDVAFTNAPTYKMSVPVDPVNIFRKNEFENVQDLRITTASEFLKEINSNFFCFPFHAMHAVQPSKAKMGISVLKKAGLIDEYVPLQCKPKFVTARFSATVVVTDKRLNILCGAPPSEPLNYGATEVPTVTPDIAALLNESLVFAASDQSTEKKSKKKLRTEPNAVAKDNEE